MNSTPALSQKTPPETLFPWPLSTTTKPVRNDTVTAASSPPSRGQSHPRPNLALVPP
ncbi:hypothetical protein TRIATDRAFT_259392 [Trichoderma atroviride IMI 206040]|uniref:Uncharacterized protein n=1 Tax=Hypocrea atroviridis (strain ATCC 20476 / IMI 206040) TaxID=452589 RepID=G9P7B6_HYPAI|nr:uncharacterized protein TRIATDRAFT_259392 [Trichoderma atroviride IMI 206040]EHK41564.1 hypothetical protein TRIATDRAFT_259392 [Trichoderma atroviride IMI 206040]